MKTNININNCLKLIVAHTVLLTCVVAVGTPTNQMVRISAACNAAVEGVNQSQEGYLADLQVKCLPAEIGILAGGIAGLQANITSIKSQIVAIESDATKLKTEEQEILADALLMDRIETTSAFLVGGGAIGLVVSTTPRLPVSSDQFETRGYRVRQALETGAYKASMGALGLGVVLGTYQYLAIENVQNAKKENKRKFMIKTSDLKLLKNVLARDEARLAVIQSLYASMEARK